MDKKKATALIISEYSMLENPPHILPELINLVSSERPLNSSEQEQMLAHLAECIPCENALMTLLVVELENERQIGLSEEPAWRLISKLSEIKEETQIRDDIPAYIEALEVQGVEEANKRFPRLAEHLKKCKACQSTVEGVRSLLHDAEEAGLITPT